MHTLWIPIIACLGAQFIKVIVSFIIEKKLNFKRLIEPGGMPSSHTATVISLATSVGLSEGFESVAFAICVVFAMIVMYDATNLRRAVGKQARILNKIMDEMEKSQPVSEEKLRELLGHTPIEVLFGGILGIAIAFMFR